MTPHRPKFPLAAAALLLLATACAGGRGTRFPDRGELEKLAARPLPPPGDRAVTTGPAQWTFAGPAAADLSPALVAPEGPWEQALWAQAGSAQAEGGLDPALRCTARELGKYALKHSAMPPADLRSWLGGRCGLTSRPSGGSWVHGETDDTESEDALVARWDASLKQHLALFSNAGAQRLGIWGGRAGTKAVLVLVGARASRAVLAPHARAPDGDGHYVVRGRITEPAERIDAAITRGAFDFADCVPIAGAEPPEFAFRCEADAQDGEAWIDVWAVPPGRVLAHTVAELLVTPSRSPPSGWVRPAFGTDPGDDAPEEPRMAKMVNEVRARAGRAPLALSLGQSETVRRLAPHFFAAARGADPERMSDKIGLGLMAGWDVERELVRHGTFITGHTAEDAPLPELMGELLSRPHGRRTLLHEDTRVLALGLSEAGGARSALLCTYRLLEPRPLAEEAAEVMHALNQARDAIGLPPAVWVAPPADAAEEAARLLEKGGDPSRGTRLLLDRTSEITGTGMQGWTLVTPALSEVRFPERLVRAPQLAVVVAVGHQRLKGDPWASYVVMLALPEMAAVRPATTAEAPGGGGLPRAW